MSALGKDRDLCQMQGCGDARLSDSQFCLLHNMSLAQIVKDSRNVGADNAVLLDLLRQLSEESKKTLRLVEEIKEEIGRNQTRGRQERGKE